MHSNVLELSPTPNEGSGYTVRKIEDNQWKVSDAGDGYAAYELLENHISDIEPELPEQVVIHEHKIGERALVLVFGSLSIIAVGMYYPIVLAFVVLALSVGFAYQQRQKMPVYADWFDNGRTVWSLRDCFSINYGARKSEKGNGQGDININVNVNQK